MIRLELELDELDFDALAEQYLPSLAEHLRASGNPLGQLLSNSVTAGMAKGMLRALDQEKKEAMAAELINANQQRLGAAIERAGAQKGVSLRVRSLRAAPGGK